ncbi:unnamed protein product [Gordionus sp. m RMFG-2023]|uniref:uncharacterized protein LOC135928342 n=1 Tax=Gordionus sp. m RMFG-2023 TaxID=3053472 RepID=UPI0030DDE7BA
MEIFDYLNQICKNYLPTKYPANPIYKFSYKFIRNALYDSLMKYEWELAAKLLKELSVTPTKDNQEAIWKAGFYLLINDPNSNANLIEEFSDTCLNFSEILKTEVILQQILYHIKHKNYDKVTQIAEKLDKPKRGAKKRLESQFKSSQILNHNRIEYNKLLIVLINQYKVLAELALYIQVHNKNHIKLHSLLKVDDDSEFLFEEKMEMEEILLDSSNDHVITNAAKEVDTRYNNDTMHSLTSILDKWVTGDQEKGDSKPVPSLFKDEEVPALDPLELSQEISGTFLALTKRSKVIKDYLTPSSPSQIIPPKLSPTTLSKMENNPPHNYANRDLDKILKNFDNCFDSTFNLTVSIVMKGESYTYLAWETFIDAYLGLLLYNRDYVKSEGVLNKMIEIYPDMWTYRLMAFNFYQQYGEFLSSDNGRNFNVLEMSHLKVLCSKDPTNPLIFTYCDKLLSSQDHVNAAHVIFDYVDRMQPKFSLDIERHVAYVKETKRILLDLYRKCKDANLVEKIDELWCKERYRKSYSEKWWPPVN